MTNGPHGDARVSESHLQEQLGHVVSAGGPSEANKEDGWPQRESTRLGRGSFIEPVHSQRGSNLRLLRTQIRDDGRPAQPNFNTTTMSDERESKRERSATGTEPPAAGR